MPIIPKKQGFASGDAIGALHVSGNLTLATGSLLAEGVSPGTADETIVTGAVSDGGDLAENFSGGAYALGSQYTILSSTGALSGTFDSVAAVYLPSDLGAQVSYDANDVILTIVAASTGNIMGGPGNDVLQGTPDDDVFNGGGDNDTVSYANAAAGITASLAIAGGAQNTMAC